MIARLHALTAVPGVSTARPASAAVPAVAPASPNPEDRAHVAEAPAAQTGSLGGSGKYLALALALVSAGGALVGSAFVPDLAPRFRGAVASQGDPTAAASRTAAPASPIEADTSVWSRAGAELGAGSILKPDHYPGLHHARLQEGRTPQPAVAGAPNFREIPGRNIFGVAQPTVQGIRNTLRQVGAGPGGERRAFWTNMREEPVVYVNGRSFNVRELEKPFANREAPGLQTTDLEAREARLLAEVKAEAAANGGRILIHEETPDGKLVARWEKLESVQTPTEVYAQLQREGYRVDFARIPVTDEQAPEAADFDALTRRLGQAEPGAALIFNCHAGRGRTTTAMVIADLLRPPQAASFTANPAVREDVKEQGRFQRGEYKVILKLIQALAQGPDSKADVDGSIDRASALQNLRESIEGYKDKADRGAESARDRGEHYLRRYFMLVSYDAYVQEQQPKGFEKTFEGWLGEHPELFRMLEGLELAMGLPAAGPTAYA